MNIANALKSKQRVNENRITWIDVSILCANTIRFPLCWRYVTFSNNHPQANAYHRTNRAKRINGLKLKGNEMSRLTFVIHILFRVTQPSKYFINDIRLWKRVYARKVYFAKFRNKIIWKKKPEIWKFCKRWNNMSKIKQISKNTDKKMLTNFSHKNLAFWNYSVLHSTNSSTLNLNKLKMKRENLKFHSNNGMRQRCMYVHEHGSF